jgi:hypothetical protein
LWLKGDREADQSHLIESLEGPAGALAEVICLIQENPQRLPDANLDLSPV